MNPPGSLTLPPLSAAARRSRITGVVRRDFAALRRSPIRMFEILFWPDHSCRELRIMEIDWATR